MFKPAFSGSVQDVGQKPMTQIFTFPSNDSKLSFQNPSNTKEKYPQDSSPSIALPAIGTKTPSQTKLISTLPTQESLKPIKEEVSHLCISNSFYSMVLFVSFQKETKLHRQFHEICEWADDEINTVRNGFVSWFREYSLLPG